MLTYDPRTISSKVYSQLNQLNIQTSADDKREQKSQAVELYNYIATWGLLRLKAEEFALSQENKRKVVKCFFQILEEIHFSSIDKEINLPEPTQSNQQAIPVSKPNRPSKPNNQPNQPTNNPSRVNTLIGKGGLDYLTQNNLSASEYLGLTGLGLEIAREFAFWAEAIYPKS
ncbi:MAG: hypothetical protein VKL02_10400 [Cylindrospermopsis raciborskii 1523720]|uniref:hypothetical protein n=1 Tax=Cylindrospermopsis raciborskii TaxID=77022 RepID=UPI002B49E126|nr:hypothetical protein [Cylindrospermopsis raciborskii]MEB3146533.1 hypothetical protein [Cylindrospermopsis raciborskii]